MKLYASRSCPYSRRVRIALAEMEVSTDYIELDPHAEHPPELLGQTPLPFGVPVLYVREGYVLWDSVGIIYWLDSAYPKSLTPSMREAQAVARSWVGLAMNQLYKPLSKLTSDDPAQRSWATNKFSQLLKHFERMAPDKNDWLVGAEFSIADIAMAPALAVLPPEVRDGAPPKMRAYIEKLRARPSVRAICEIA